MGVYQYTDPQTQRSYDFNIAGDVPSNEDFAKIQQYLQGERTEYSQKYEDVFNREYEEPDDGTAIGRGFARGKKQIKQAVGETLGTIGEEAGLGFLANYGQGLEQRAQQELGQLLLEQPERMQSTDVTGLMSGLTYAGEVAGEQIPQLGLGLGAAVAVPVLAGATGVVAPFAIGATAAAGITAPILFGNNIQRQEDEVAAGKKASVDIGAALSATFGQAALEGISDRILLGSIFRPLGKSIFTRTASRAGGGATTESLTEVGQQMMERAQAGLPIDSEDAIAEYREAAIAGGLVGGGTRATIGSLGERDPDAPPITETTETGGTATGAVGQVVQDTQTTPPVTPEVTPAQQKEVENAADPTSPKGKAQQTDAERTAATAATAVAAATESSAFVADQANAVKTQDRINEKLKEKAVSKTKSLFPSIAESQESGTAAIESEQTGQQIEVKPKDATTARVVQVLQKAKEQQLSGSAKLVSKTGIKSLYDAGLVDEGALVNPIAANLEATRLLRLGPDEVLAQVNANKKRTRTKDVAVTPQEQVIDDDFLASLSVPKQALIRREGTKKSLVGKKVSDEGVLDELRNYANISSVPEAKEGVQGFLDGLEVENAGVRPEPEAVGTSVPDSRPSVAGTGRAGSGVESAVQPTPPESRPVGTDMPTTVPPVVATREQPDTLETTPDAQGIEAVKQLAEKTTATPVQVTPQTEATPAMQQAAVGGAETGAAGQVIPGVARFKGSDRVLSAQQDRFAPSPAPEAPVQAAPVPQEQLQVVEDQRNVAAQSALNELYQKQPQAVQEFHDAQVADLRDAPDVTTALDKEAVVELLSTKKKDLNDGQKAARLYFERFRRPSDALAEIGALTVVGPKKTFKKDYTEGQLPFYKGMTQGSALEARKWIFDNMSPQANEVMRTARVQAKRDTSEFNPSDAYIVARKFAKQVIDKEREAYNKQLAREANEFTEVSRVAAAAKKMQLDQTMAGRGAISGMSIARGGTQTALDTVVRSEATGRELFRVTTPIKGETAFDAYLLSMGFKKRKLPKQDDYYFFDPDTKEVLTDAEIMDFYDGWAASRKLGFLLPATEVNAIDGAAQIIGLNQAALPSMRNALRNNDLKGALQGIAATNPFERVRQVAGKLSLVVGDTQVQVVDNLSQMVGRKAAGLFSPEENTIYIDANNGMNVHTILHEMTHAATSASLANPSLPEVKQLQRILINAKEQLGEFYGTANLDEFVAEAFGNSEFQAFLTLLNIDGTPMSGWEIFTGAIKRIVRKILGLSPTPTAAEQVDILIDGMLSPSPATRAAPNMLMAAGSPKGSAQLGQSIVTAVPASKKDQYIQMAGDVLYNTTDSTMQGAKNVLLGSLDSRMLTDVAKSKIPFAPQLNVLIRQMSGAMRNRSDVLESMLNDYRGWARKNKEAAAVLNNLIPRSTFLRVDPSMPKSFYSSWKVAYNDLTAKKSVVKEFNSEKEQQAWIKNFNENRDEAKFTTAKKMPDPDPDTIKQWTDLNNQYKSLGKDGQAYYRQIRNFFQDTYDEIIPALRSRLEATIKDKAVRATAFEKLQDILMKESGLIRPYFPLMRKGKHRLQYSALDENGQPEVYVEYYQNRKELERAFKVAESLSASGTKPEYSRADKPMNFNSVPSSSFVYSILQTMEASKSDFKNPEQYQEAVQSIVDLALDAMPERSFMQGFRRRGDKDNPLGYRGFIGDTTPTGAGGVEFDVATMLKEKGRDLNRQIVQIQASAEIEKFRNELSDGGYLTNPETADIARYIDKVASFAQKPNVPRWSQTLNALGFNMTMGLNFSSAAITFFDVGMSAMPVISAEYGIKNTAGAYKTAASLFARSPKTRTMLVTGPDGQPVEQEVRMGIAGKSLANYDLETLPQELKDLGLDVLVKMGADQGQFNQSLTQESLEVSRDAPLEGVNKWTSAMFHHSERFNRETTLTAAYLLEAKKLLAAKGQLTDADKRAAAQKAIETTEFTLGSTAAAGRPVWAQSGVGNVLFLFKRFAMAKYYMMYKLGIESIGTTNASKIMQELSVTEAEAQEIVAQRKIARAGMRNFLASTGVMAGLGGMPLMGGFGVIYNMFADDDEDDFEAATRKLVGEGIYGGLANEILGVDVANRISMNSLLYRAPIIEKDQSPLWTLIEQLGGPVIGVTNSILRGAPEIYNGLVEGDMSTAKRGVEAVSPSALRNAFKGWRFYTEGATTRRGDPITEDINAYNATMQTLGFAPQAYIQQLEFNKNARRRNEAVNSKRTKLLRRRNMAMREGDYEELQNVDALIEKFNAELPQGAKKSRITSETKQRSFRSFGKTTNKMRGGMTYTPFMEEILEEYDKGFQLF